MQLFPISSTPLLLFLLPLFLLLAILLVATPSFLNSRLSSPPRLFSRRSYHPPLPLPRHQRPSLRSLPTIPNFHCRFLAVLNDSPCATVLLVSVGPYAKKRVLKLYKPRLPDQRDSFTPEYLAYKSLRHYGLSMRPPGDRVVPYCYGCVRIADASCIDGLPPKLLPDEPLNALLLEYIHSSSLTEASISPEIVDKTVGALGRIHEAGVLHREVRPRNVLITGEGEVVWVDFDSAKTKGEWLITGGHFRGERERVKWVLEDMVVEGLKVTR